MIKALYYLRINAAFVFALILALPFLGNQNGLRGPASTPQGSCFTVMRERLSQHGGFSPRGPALKEKIPNFAERAKAIEKTLIPPKAFARKFQSEKGRPPKLQEVIDFFTTGHQETLSKIKKLNEGVEQDGDIKYYVNETLKALQMSDKEKQNIADYIEENSAILSQPFDHTNPGLIQKMEQLWKNPFGDYGELIVALKTPGVEVQNLHIRLKADEAISDKARVHKTTLKTAIDEKFQELGGMSDSQLSTLARKYPNVFNEQRSTELSDVRNWIDSKEVDLVVDVQGRGHYFVEVKNYSKKMTRQRLNDTYGSNKSVLDQQKEMVEIIHLLGLERKYIPAIFFLKGIDDDAKDLLEENGVLVITDELTY